MLEQLVDLGVIEFFSEPLNAIVERRLKAIWTTRTCPNYDADTLHVLDGSARIWCGRCGWKTTYTRGTPFYDSELAPGEFLVAFVLYADTILSINQIVSLLDRTYKTVFEAIKDVEAAFARGFLTVWDRVDHTIDGPTQVDETQQVCSEFKGQNPPRDGLSRGGSPEGGRTPSGHPNPPSHLPTKWTSRRSHNSPSRSATVTSVSRSVSLADAVPAAHSWIARAAASRSGSLQTITGRPSSVTDSSASAASRPANAVAGSSNRHSASAGASAPSTAAVVASAAGSIPAPPPSGRTHPIPLRRKGSSRALPAVVGTVAVYCHPGHHSTPASRSSSR